jgi:hypothetical protein
LANNFVDDAQNVKLGGIYKNILKTERAAKTYAIISEYFLPKILNSVKIKANTGLKNYVLLII